MKIKQFYKKGGNMKPMIKIASVLCSLTLLTSLQAQNDDDVYYSAPPSRPTSSPAPENIDYASPSNSLYPQPDNAPTDDYGQPAEMGARGAKPDSAASNSHRN